MREEAKSGTSRSGAVDAQPLRDCGQEFSRAPGVLLRALAIKRRFLRNEPLGPAVHAGGDGLLDRKFNGRINGLPHRHGLGRRPVAPIWPDRRLQQRQALRGQNVGLLPNGRRVRLVQLSCGDVQPSPHAHVPQSLLVVPGRSDLHLRLQPRKLQRPRRGST